jgi:hypothetical protein
MDSDVLVDDMIEDGRRLTRRLVQEGVPLLAAFWLKRSSEDRCFRLYLSTPLYNLQDQTSRIAAHAELTRVFRMLTFVELGSDDVQLLGEHDPTTAEVVRILQAYGGIRPRRIRDGRFGPEWYANCYVYPSPKRLAHAELTDEERRLLVALYDRCSLSLDDLPYTCELERLHEEFLRQTDTLVTPGDLFRTLKDLQRQSRLPPKGRGPTPPVEPAAAPPTVPAAGVPQGAGTE